MKKIFLLLLLSSSFMTAQQESQFKSIDSLLSKGRYQPALEQLTLLEDSFVKLNKIGSIYYQVDKIKLAISYFEKALELKDDYQIRVQLGKAYQKIKDYKKAIEAYEYIVEKDPDNLLLTYQLGKLYLLTKRANKGIILFKSLEKKDLTNPNYPYQRARAYAMKKQRDSMIDTFLEAYKIDSTHIKSIYQLANSFFKLRETDSTFIFIEAGLKVEPTHRNLLKLKVNQQFLLKDYKSSIQTLKILDSLYPNSKFANSMLGKSHFNSGNYKEAKKYLKKAMELDRSDYKILTNLAHVDMQLGEYKKALVQYRLASRMGKTPMPDEYYGMGNAYLKMEQAKEAVEMYRKAYEEGSRDYKLLFQLAKTSDDYYIEKKRAYKYYREYVFRFPRSDQDMTNFANKRIKEIKKQYFLKGESLGDW